MRSESVARKRKPTLRTAAGAAVQAALSQVAGNASAIQSVINAHIVNGATVFSTQLANAGSPTTRAGTQLTFSTNSTGAFVTGSGVTAQIVLPNGLSSQCSL